MFFFAFIAVWVVLMIVIVARAFTELQPHGRRYSEAGSDSSWLFADSGSSGSSGSSDCGDSGSGWGGDSCDGGGGGDSGGGGDGGGGGD